MATQEEKQAKVMPLTAIPGGKSPSQEEGSVALLIGAGLVGLWAVRKGLKGIGPVQLTGSAVGGFEFVCYLMVVGGAIRTAQANWPENPLVKATAFIY